MTRPCLIWEASYPRRMNPSRLAGLVVFTVLLAFLSSSRSWADDGSASLKDVHDILLAAAGDGPDNAPPIEKQKTLLGDALKDLRHIPHIYHGKLNEARRDIESALNELSSADTASRARHDILDAADVIKGLMD